MPDLPPSKRLRLKFAAIGTIGAAMVLLPLAQVLRYQNADLDAVVAERATLDPLAHAVAVQRSLLGHRDVSERVLRGRLQLEAERRLRKAEVDDALWALQGTLSAGFWVKALRESDALTQDWRLLAGRVALRQVQVADSLAGHQLLLEQAVQVMDLVGAAAPASPQQQLLRLAMADPARAEAQGQAQSQAQSQAQTAAVLLPPRLAALETALQARIAALDERSATLRAQQRLLALAGTAIVALVLALVSALAGWAWRSTPPSGQSGSPPSGAAADRVRRSSGRRSVDGAHAVAVPAPQAASHQVLQRLREAGAKAVAGEPDSRPPQS